MPQLTHGGPAGFLAAAPVDDHVTAMYASDLELQGYVANLTRIWAWSPEALGALSFLLRLATDMSGTDAHQRALLTSVTASSLGDSYCSLAFGLKLAMTGGDDVAVTALAGRPADLDPRDRLLAEWARRVTEDPSATTAEDVDELRAAGYDDGQIFALTLFVALRMAFSTVNDALGAAPDAELADRVPAAVRAAVTWGRAPQPVTVPTSSSAAE